MRYAYSAIAVVRVASQRSNAGLSDVHFPQLTAQMRDWRDEVKGVAMANSTDSAYALSDSAGFYWAKLKNEYQIFMPFFAVHRCGLMFRAGVRRAAGIDDPELRFR